MGTFSQGRISTKSVNGDNVHDFIIQFSHLLNNVGIHNDKKRYVYKDN